VVFPVLAVQEQQHGSGRKLGIVDVQLLVAGEDGAHVFRG